MATLQQFEELEIWQLARQLYNNVMPVVKRLKQMKRFRFAAQMEAAAGSIMDNIAEGFERNSRFEFVQALSIAKGECGELRSQLYRCLDDAVIDPITFEQQHGAALILGRKLANFIKYLNGSDHQGLKFKNRDQTKP